MARRLRPAGFRGFSLIELMLVVSVLVVMVTMAVPTTLNVTEALRLNGAAREFEREMQSARLKAVQSNRTLRVRFNCPSPGQYRRVEVMRSSVDTAAARCSETAYRFPSPRDSDPSTPAHDGPVRYMPTGLTFASAAQAIEFRPDGRAFQVVASQVRTIAAGGVQLTLTKGSHSAAVVVNGLGRVELR